MSTIKIYLADLTHTMAAVISDTIPSNIGLIASYARKVLGHKLDIRLFKYPDKLEQAILADPPDVMGCSNYIWNARLADWASRLARRANPEVLTTWGGWNFPMDDPGRAAFLKRMPSCDIHAINEGELAFVEILQRYIAGGRAAVLAGPVPGCAALDKDGSLLQGPPLPRIDNLDEVPSPFSTGLLDEFFDGKLTPVLETTRGCPFHCNYCNSSQKAYSTVRSFSDEYVMAELEHMGRMAAQHGAGPLIIADTNFGMYERDIRISEKINDLRTRFGWPHSILLTTGKNKVDRVLEAVLSLKDILVPSISVQSMNPATLEEIGRSNLALPLYRYLADYAEAQGLTIYAETIVPLPLETLDTFWAGTKELLEAGAKKVISYTLQLNNGTIYRCDDYLEKHGYEGAYRLIPNAYGIYAGEKVFDMEKVGVATRTMNSQDYLQARCITLYTELMFNNYCFHELICFLKELGFSLSDYLDAVRSGFDQAPQALLGVRESFLRETQAELFPSEEELIAFYSQAENFARLTRGEVGGNVVYKHKAWVYGQHAAELVDYVISRAQGMLRARGCGAAADEALEDLRVFFRNKFSGMFDRTEPLPPLRGVLRHDILGWMDQAGAKKLTECRKDVAMDFLYTDFQKELRQELFALYPDTVAGRTRVLAKAMQMQHLLRTPVREE